MHKGRFFWMPCVLMLLCIFSCATTSTNPEEDRRQEEAVRAIGEAYLKQQQFNQALKELHKAEKIFADDHILQNDLALTYMGKGHIDIAISHFKRAIELKPDYAVAKNNLGTAYIFQSKWDLAIEVFESIFEDLFYATPHYPLSNLGWAYFNKQNFALAEKYYLQALEIEPNFSVALRGLGRTYTRVGKDEKAVKILERAVVMSAGPPKGEAYFLLAKAYMAVGDNNNARQALVHAVEFNPDSEMAKEAKKTLNELQ